MTNHWRPRFSLRSLFIVLTVTCAYLASWWPTREFGIDQVKEHVYLATRLGNQSGASSPLPLVVSLDLAEEVHPFHGLFGERQYYLWLFGPVVTLPFSERLKYEVYSRPNGDFGVKQDQ